MDYLPEQARSIRHSLEEEGADCARILRGHDIDSLQLEISMLTHLRNVWDTQIATEESQRKREELEKDIFRTVGRSIQIFARHLITK